MSRVPPARLLASPIEETVTSSFVPGRAQGGNVADLNREDLARHVDAHALQHVGERLDTEEGLLFVAGPVEADDEAVANKHVVADAFNGGDVFEAGDVGRRSSGLFIGESRRADERRGEHGSHAAEESGTTSQSAKSTKGANQHWRRP